MYNVDNQGEKFKLILKTIQVKDEKGSLYQPNMEEIAGLLNVSRNTLYTYFNTKKLSKKVLNNIENQLGITLEDILNYKEEGGNESFVSSVGMTKSEFLLKSDSRSPIQKVPLYDVKASAGLVQLFQSDNITPIDWISIPNLPKCDGAMYITGDSMYPLLKSGDIAIYKHVNDLKDGLFWGEMYIVAVDIDGDEMTTAKYIQKSELGSEYIKLVSQNQYHAPKDIKLKHLKAAALVKASIRMNTIL